MSQWHAFAHFPALLATGTIDLVSDEYRAILLDDSFTFSEATVLLTDYASQIAGNEIVATGYTAAGQAISNKYFAIDPATGLWKWGCANVTWTNVAEGATPGGAMIYHFSTGKLVLWNDTPDKATTGRDVILQVPTEGLITWKWLPDNVRLQVDLAGV